MAAIYAAKGGAEVTLLERNDKIGKKLFITGKGRCNITNLSDHDNYLKNIVSNPKFALRALKTMSPQGLIQFFNDSGLPIKIERGNRVFPLSDKSSDVIKVLNKLLENSGVKVFYNQKLWILR